MRSFFFQDDDLYIASFTIHELDEEDIDIEDNHQLEVMCTTKHLWNVLSV